MAKKVLGKGLSALLTPVENLNNDAHVLNLEIEDIIPNSMQPRKDIDLDKIQDLAVSIRENGIIHPILVARKGEKFEIIVGERRWRACKLLKHEKIPAIIKDITSNSKLQIALIENIQRQDLNCIEEAQTYKQLLENLSITHQVLSEKIGKSRTSITNTLRLLKLPEAIQKDIISKKISEGHARCLLSLSEDLTSYIILIKEFFVKYSLSVRKIESLIKLINKIILKNPILLTKFSDKDEFIRFLKAIYEDSFNLHSFIPEKAMMMKTKEKKLILNNKENIPISFVETKNKLYKYLNSKIKILQNKNQDGGILKIYYNNEKDLKRILEHILT